VASSYCWRSLDLSRNTQTVAKGIYDHRPYGRQCA